MHSISGKFFTPFLLLLLHDIPLKYSPIFFSFQEVRAILGRLEYNPVRAGGCA